MSMRERAGILKTVGRAALLGSASVALAACGSGQAEETSAMAVAVVERGDLRITAEATGSVEPILQVEVTSKASGEIFDLHVDVGDVVSRGDLLAEVDPRDVRNDFEESQADLEVAEARLRIAEAQRERSRELLEAEVITEQEHEGRDLEYANARAQLVKARTNLELARLRLTDVTIGAPLDGTILQRSVEEGQVIQSASQNVSGGTTLFVMANLDQMQVRTLVDETDMGEIRAGMTANVQVEAFPDRTFRGEVEKIEPQAVVEQNVTMFPVIVRLDNRDGFLKPGMNAEVEILIAESRNVMVVPNNAVVNVQDAAPAAAVLGLDPAELPFGQGRLAGGRSAAGGPDAAAGDNGPPSGGGPSARGDAEGRRAAMAERGFRRDAGGSGADAEGAEGLPPRETRPAVVFVVTGGDNGIEPRMVQVGLNDWDNTEVVSGLEEGEQLAVIGAAQLQAQQEEFLNRIRSRRDGPF